MQKKPQTEPSKDKQQTAEPSEKRHTNDRRKAKSNGYTYIPMVGWYCRRDETRRDDDETLK